MQLFAGRTIAWFNGVNGAGQIDFFSLISAKPEIVRIFAIASATSAGQVAVLPVLLMIHDCLCLADIFRNTAAEGKFCQPHRIGAERTRLAGRDQLVGGGNRVGDISADFQQHMFVQSRHLRPVFDVRAADQFGIRITLAKP